MARGAFLALLVALAKPAAAQAADLIENGSFAEGFSGWTLYDTAVGYRAPAGFPPIVTAFDVAGSGTPQQAARLQVGAVEFNDYDPSFIGGGGLRQTLNVAASGTYGFAAAIAASNPDAWNADGGTFTVYLDGLAMTSFTFGEIGEGSVLRGGLSFSTTLSAGMHDLAIEAVRVFETRPSTPYQYVTGITLAGEVPEPTGWAMMIAGFGLIGARLRRVHSAASASSASACWRFHISA